MLWEISYVNLNMMLSDAITIDYDDVSENRATSGGFMNADDPNNSDLIIGQYSHIR